MTCVIAVHFRIFLLYSQSDRNRRLFDRGHAGTGASGGGRAKKHPGMCGVVLRWVRVRFPNRQGGSRPPPTSFADSFNRPRDTRGPARAGWPTNLLAVFLAMANGTVRREGVPRPCRPERPTTAVLCRDTRWCPTVAMVVADAVGRLAPSWLSTPTRSAQQTASAPKLAPLWLLSGSSLAVSM